MKMDSDGEDFQDLAKVLGLDGGLHRALVTGLWTGKMIIQEVWCLYLMAILMFWKKRIEIQLS